MNLAHHYVDTLVFGLVHNAKNSKRPVARGWQDNPILDPDKAQAIMAKGDNIGLHHGASRTVVLDIDNEAFARIALEALGTSLDELLAAEGPKILTPRGPKPLYRLPDGFEPDCKALSWRVSDGSRVTVLELRGGSAQDLIEPSVHPSGQPYGWAPPGPPRCREDIPELPGCLRTLWENWGASKAKLEQASPWAPPPLPRTYKGDGSGVIGAYNAAVNVRNVLERNGYTPAERDRYLAPSSTTGNPGISFLTGDDGLERAYSHHGSDSLADGHTHDPFSAFCILEHGGDVKAAVKAAAALSNISIAGSPVLIAEPEWGGRSALPSVRPEVPTLPLDLVPAPLRPWIEDASARLCVHPEFVAVPALVSAGSVIGRTVGVFPKRHDDWIVVANLWGALIGGPSAAKSPALAEGTSPLTRLAAQARSDYEQQEAERLVNRELLQLEIAQLKKDGKKSLVSIRTELLSKTQELKRLEDEGLEKRFSTNDATTEKLAELLKANPKGLLVMRDELTAWLNSFNKPGREGDRAFYLEAWNGLGQHSVDRIGRGTLHVPSLTLSILGTIQPARLDSYVRGAVNLDDRSDADGLLQRFQLAVWPDRPPAWLYVDRRPDEEARCRALSVYSALDTLNPARLDIEPGHAIPALRFSEEAQELVDAWRDELKTRVRLPEIDEAAPAFGAHLNKYDLLLPKLALTFHLIDVVDGLATGPVSFEATELAVQWCTFLEAHARKIYAPELNVELNAAHLLEEKIQEGELDDGTPQREVLRRGWPGLKTKAQLESALSTLEQHGWVRLEKREAGLGGGRPSHVIRVHPDLRGRL